MHIFKRDSLRPLRIGQDRSRRPLSHRRMLFLSRIKKTQTHNLSRIPRAGFFVTRRQKIIIHRAFPATFSLSAEEDRSPMQVEKDDESQSRGNRLRQVPRDDVSGDTIDVTARPAENQDTSTPHRVERRLGVGETAHLRGLPFVHRGRCSTWRS